MNQCSDQCSVIVSRSKSRLTWSGLIFRGRIDAEVFSLYLHTWSAPAALIKALWSCQCWLDRSELMFLACTFRIEISVCQSTKFASRNFGECNAVPTADDHCSWKLSLAGPNGRSSRHIAFPESKAREGVSSSYL